MDWGPMLVMAIIAVIIGLGTYYNNQAEKRAEEEAAEVARKAAIVQHQENIQSLEQRLDNLVRSYFRAGAFLIDIGDEMTNILKSTNVESMALISNGFEKDIANQFYENVKEKCNCFKSFWEQRLDGLDSFIVDGKHYGRIYTEHWNSVCSMDGKSASARLNKYLDQMTTVEGAYELLTLKPYMCMELVWYFAMKKPFSAEDFQRAIQVYKRAFKVDHIDFIIADLYAKNQMGGEDVLQETVRNLLKTNRSGNQLTIIASALMWMKAYKSEAMILQHMLANGMEMNAKTQERLHALTNGGGKAPGSFEVKSSGSSLYFDVSALAWREEEYVGMFENLAFQDKTLTYSLAIRDENKELFVAQGLSVPNMQVIYNKFEDIFAEEYGTGVKLNLVNSIALSGSGEEHMDGILVTATECNQMSILIHIAKIGKKLIIKFYTLFMPAGADLAVQKQQALSVYKKLSLSVTMWESSLKDTMLMAVEQLLNAGNQTSADTSETVEPDHTDTPIF